MNNIKLDLVKKCEKAYTDPSRILGSGVVSTVYAVDDKIAAKVYKSNSEAVKDLARTGFDVASDLFNNGFQVPKMIGVLENFLGKYVAVFMERIHGTEEIKLSNPQQQGNAKRQHVKELERALKLGYCPLDSSPRNALFDSTKDTLYLIDFDKWRKGTEEELANHHKDIQNGQYTRSF